MALSIHEGDQHIRGALSCQSLAIPSGTVDNAAVSASAAIADSKLICVRTAEWEIAEDSDAVAASTKTLHISRAAGSLIAFETIIADVTGLTGTFTVDLQKCTAATTWTSVLTGTISHSTTTVVRTPNTGTISNTTMADGDIWRAVVAISGSTIKGAHATLTYSEKYV